MSGGPGTASREVPSQDGGSGEWRRIYDRVEVLAAAAGERARLAEAREKSLHARLLQAEASRRRWKTAYIEMPLLANPKIIELKENDLKDYQSCEDDDHLQFKILPTEATSSVEVRQYNEDHEAIAGELRAELRKLKQAYETLSSEKDKEISGLLGVKDFLWNQLRTIDKENMGLLKIKEVEAAQATEAAQKIHQNIEDMQVAAQKVQQNIEGMKVAARKKDDKVGRLQAEASNVKKKVLIDDGKLLEMHSLIKDKNDEIQRLKSKARRKHSKIACEKHLEQCTCYIMAPKESPKEALFQMRFAAKRLRGVVEKNMSAAKREIIARTPFRELLYVSPFAAPMELIEFVVMNTNPKLREFRFRDKAIVFTRDMVRRVLGVPSGNRPMDFLKRSQQSEIRDKYKNEKGRTTVAKAIELLETCADTDELMVVQSFGLIAFATVLCPGTGNTVCCEYLGSLMDINAIEQYAMDEHILSEVMSEVELFKEKVQRRPELDGTQIQWIGQCLPMLATIYMDFLSFPALAPGEHTINYNIPRFCYVCDADFELVVEIDKNKLSLLPASFGNRPLLPLSRTVYAPAATANTPPSNGAKVDANASPPLGAMAKEGDAKKNSEDVEVNLSASLNEWPDKHLPSSQDLQVPECLQGLYNKHKDLYASEVDAALNHIGQFVKVLQAKRMTTLLVDVNTAHVASSKFTIPCTMSSAHPAAVDAPQDEQAKELNPNNNLEKNAIQDDVSDNVVIEAVNKELGVGDPACVPRPEHVCVASPTRTEQPVPTIVSPSKLPRTVQACYWDDVPSVELFPSGSEDALFFEKNQVIPSGHQSTAVLPSGGSSGFATPQHREDANATQSPAPAATIIQEAQERFCDVLSGPSTHEKKNRFKRASKEPERPPKVKKMKVSDTHEEV